MFINHFPVVIRCGDTLEIVQDQIMTGMRFGYHGTEELPYELSLPGMAGKFKLNVENNSKMDESNILPYLMRGDWDFAAAESAALQPPEGIDGELTLMAYPGSQLRLDFFYSPASIDRIFVKRFCASLLRRLRLIGE
jgi:hypothetical protein